MVRSVDKQASPREPWPVFDGQRGIHDLLVFSDWVELDELAERL
jgi:hypothetical protein